ncbi:MAG: glycosyltransferase family 4 protein [Candidatus Aenigmatarchaeota archaeon]
MHICMLSELFYPYLFGGAERRYLEIAKRLSKKHEITVYSLKLNGCDDHEIYKDIEIIRLGIRHGMGKRSLFPLLSYKPFLKALKSEYDVIDANQGMASFMGFFAPLTRRPIVATFHDIYWDQWSSYFSKPYSWFGKSMEFFWSRLRYDRIIANSPPTEKKLRQLGFKSDITTIVSGIDLDFINSVKARKVDQIIYVGRLIKYKNVDMLLKAFGKVKTDTKLIIVGTGPEEENLKRMTKKLKINVEFRGFVPEREKIRLIKSSQFLINPSSVEGLGLILAESMACGTPVVAKDLSTYFFCNKNNSLLGEKLAENITKLLQDDGFRNKLRKNGLDTAKMFSWDRTAENVERVYKELL